MPEEALSSDVDGGAVLALELRLIGVDDLVLVQVLS